MDKEAALKPNITVYYDGLCHLCSREVGHYQRMKGAENIHFVDITEAAFDAGKEGLNPVEIHKTMHVRDKNGKIVLGIDAFISIWNELPSLRFLVPIASFRAVHFILKTLYAGFARIRPLLPRKSCENSPYCEIKYKS